MSETDFAISADDNTPYVTSNKVNDVIKILENDDIRLFKWFSDNQMKTNKDKYQLIVGNNEYVSIKIDDIEVENSDREKLLGIKIDLKLNFMDHLDGVRPIHILLKIFKGLAHTEILKFQTGIGFLGVLVTF